MAVLAETGIAVLSNIFKSASPKKINIAIMRTFTTLRKVAINHKAIMQIITEMRNK